MLVYMYSSFPFLLQCGFFDKAPFTNVMEGARINGSISWGSPRAPRKNERHLDSATLAQSVLAMYTLRSYAIYPGPCTTWWLKHGETTCMS